jgi:hypothetical protein
MRKVSILTGFMLAAFIMTVVLSIAIRPAMAASSSLPEGAILGSGMGFRSPFMGMGGFFGGGPWEDMDDMDLGFGGMMGQFGMGQFGAMNPWMMRGMDQFEDR